MGLMAPQDLWLKLDGSRSARYGKGKRWRVGYTDPHTGAQTTAAFTRKTDAETFENNVKADISRGQYIDPRAGQITVREYGEMWRKTLEVDPATANKIERTLRLHVYPMLGNEALAVVANSHIRGWVANRAKVLAPLTLTVIYSSVLKPLFATAVVDRRIGSTPCVAIRLPTVPKRPYFIPSAKAVHLLAKALLPRFRAVPWLAAGCGLRPGEIMGLEKSGVAFLGRQVEVVQQLKYVSGRGLHLAPTKTKETRTVDLAAIVAEAVAEQIRVAPPRTVPMLDETDPRKIKEDPDTGERIVPIREAELLFTMSNGRAIYSTDWAAIWADAVAAAELPRGYRLHDLRHFFATSLIHHGASVVTVQRALGHASATTTLATYSHEWPDLLERTRAVMDNVLSLDAETSEATG
jgi:integrase